MMHAASKRLYYKELGSIKASNIIIYKGGSTDVYVYNVKSGKILLENTNLDINPDRLNPNQKIRKPDTNIPDNTNSKNESKTDSKKNKNDSSKNNKNI